MLYIFIHDFNLPIYKYSILRFGSSSYFKANYGEINYIQIPL